MVKCKKDIVYDLSPFIMEGSVVGIDNEGNKELKQPLRFTFRFEDSSDFIKCVSWNFELMDQLKLLKETQRLCTLKAAATMYKETPSIRIGSIESVSGNKSKFSITTEKPSYEEEIKNIIATIKNPVFIPILNDLILENKEFFTHPAARTMHHNYEGGLVKHSLNVMKRALTVIGIYGGNNIDRDLLVAGALLHDIGKLREYNADGTISDEGEFMTHLVSGVEMVKDVCRKYSIKTECDDIKYLCHIIMSHHGKMEFGSPLPPRIIESFIIANADDGDAKFEAISNELLTTNKGEFTERMAIIDGGKVFSK